MKSVKVPKEIHELFFEVAALRALASEHNHSWLPSPKAFVYRLKAEKVAALAWRTLRATYPQITATWTADIDMGIVSEPAPPIELAQPKKPRVPRKPKAVTAPATQGEVPK